ncbi:MAG: hypothetical protein LBH03_03790 [Holophagales bacterium]|nr:hypothetical protein [Holophagales bacterium]
MQNLGVARDLYQSPFEYPFEKRAVAIAVDRFNTIYWEPEMIVFADGTKLITPKVK